MPAPLPWWDIPARMAVTLMLVAVILSSADRLGPQLSGVVSTYPVILIVIGCGAMFLRPELWHPFVPPNTGEFGSFVMQRLNAAGLLLKDKKLKVQAQIMDEQVRVTGKNRDDLQAVIALLRGKDLGIALQFTNYHST